MFSIDTRRPASNRVQIAVDVEQQFLSTGVPTLDGVLPGGGFPRGKLSELSGGRSCGKRSLAAALCTATLLRGEAVAWIDGGGEARFYPVLSLEHGLPLQKMIVVRAAQSGTGEDRKRRPKVPPAIQAAEILLSTGAAVALVIVDLPPAEVVPQRLLSRLRLGVETSGAALVFITEQRVMRRGPGTHALQSLGTFICLRLNVYRKTTSRVAVSVAKSKLGKMAHQAMVTFDEPHSLRLDTTV